MSAAFGRVDALDFVAARIPVFDGQRCPRIAIDGPDGAGKTHFADALAELLRDRQRPVVRVSLDDFHNTREVRYRLGRSSPGEIVKSCGSRVVRRPRTLGCRAMVPG